MAYKQFQRELDKEREQKEKSDFKNLYDDANRKQDEKERRWRQFYEDFAHQQENKMNDYTSKVIKPMTERERQEEFKRLHDAEQILAKERERLLANMGKKAQD
eukprot:CAMPEP_0202961212 /NCGR_PEP_ID=MMETSP1396-20130829/5268_1 /ASSEMBLY_ACC=CAM_ASM_000872 /TAXON_ID= /ORGANISM="Pseudokeronopsis sp., Strain Brazil" /LENGTH=102 /DNA_ID=CAMNT_0049680873 /DNA_START=566 /DNA_END=874 /DNA_ORIENTATION=-